jgi:hypothetical protein
MNFATLRMGTLRASDSAVHDVECDPVANLDDVDIGSGVTDAEPEPSMLSFFNGKPYAEGLKAYNEHRAAKRSK